MELTDEERQVLLELLETAHSDVLHQLHHADTQTYKQILKRKVSVIEALQQRLKADADRIAS